LCNQEGGREKTEGRSSVPRKKKIGRRHGGEPKFLPNRKERGRGALQGFRLGRGKKTRKKKKLKYINPLLSIGEEKERKKGGTRKGADHAVARRGG